MKSLFSSVIGVTALSMTMLACSGSSDGGSSGSGSQQQQGQGSSSSSGSHSGGTSGGSSTPPPSSTSSEQSCSAAAVNGVCYDGPHKGTSCCMPDEDNGITCKAGTDCDTVCKWCQ